MPILNEDKSGDDTLYKASIDGTFAWLTAGTTYLCTSLVSATINLDAASSSFTVAGAVGGRGDAFWIGGSNDTLEITATGTVYGAHRAVVFTSGGSNRLINHGTIDSAGPAIMVAPEGLGAYVSIVNYGTISGSDGTVSLYSAHASVVNYGVIGSIGFGDFDDYLDTHLGKIGGTILGQGGDDTYVIAGDEEILEQANEGFDDVTSYGDFVLPDYVEQLTLAGAARIGFGNASDNILIANPLGSQMRGGAGYDQLRGGVGDDLLRGGTGVDQLSGGGGYDRLHGGTGDDRVQLDGEEGGKAYGEAGNDVLVSGDGSDLLDGGDGVDRADYDLSPAAVRVDLTTGRVSGGYAEGDKLVDIEDVAGSAFDDVLLGSSGANRLFGGMGKDSLSGLDGADVLTGGGGADVLDGGVGTDTASYATSSEGVRIVLGVSAELGDAAGDTLIAIENVTGSEFADKLTGLAGANALIGLGGDDYLLGGDGNDVLEGGAGNDELHGDRNRDTFVFSDVTSSVPGGWGRDIIDDFADGTDRIDLRGASAVHSFADLTITNGPSGALITVGADTIELWNITPAQVDPSDFLFA